MASVIMSLCIFDSVAISYACMTVFMHMDQNINVKSFECVRPFLTSAPSYPVSVFTSRADRKSVV